MSGNREGGLKAAATNKQRYGLGFYKQIGRDGGKISRGGGFQKGAEWTIQAGIKGGKRSRRTKNE